MGLSSGVQALPFGHSAEAVASIEGLDVRFCLCFSIQILN